MTSDCDAYLPGSAEDRPEGRSDAEAWVFAGDTQGNELQLAVEEFAQQYPDVTIQIEHGNHEELYNLLRTEGVDLIFN